MPAGSPVHNVPLQELPLRQSTSTRLRQKGFVTVGEMQDSRRKGGMATLAAELEVSLPEAMRIFQEVLDCTSPSNGEPSEDITPTLDASQLLSISQARKGSIVSFCQDIDNTLGGGIPLGSVTEIAGLPGTGKTQLAMQLAVNARLPRILGGVEGRTLYIDAEGSLAPERLFAMANALVSHAGATLRRRPSQSPSVLETFTTDTILDSISVFRVHDEAAQTATIYSLPHYLGEPSELPVKLIVVDSIAFHYRAQTPYLPKSGSHNPRGGGPTNSSYFLHRTQALTRLAAFLGDLARQFDVAIVCINQMTTKLTEGTPRLVPALGESWAHATSTRLLLSKNDGNYDSHSNQHRTCTLVKSPNQPSRSAKYQVTEEGIRGIQASRESAGGTRSPEEAPRGVERSPRGEKRLRTL